MAVTTPMMTTAMSAAIKPYLIAVAPDFGLEQLADLLGYLAFCADVLGIKVQHSVLL